MLTHCDTAATAADFSFSDEPPVEVKAPLNIKHLSTGKHAHYKVKMFY